MEHFIELASIFAVALICGIIIVAAQVFFFVYEPFKVIKKVISNTLSLVLNFRRNSIEEFETRIENIILKYNLPVEKYLYFKLSRQIAAGNGRITLYFQANNEKYEYTVTLEKDGCDQHWFDNYTDNKKFLEANILNKQTLVAMKEDLIKELHQVKQFIRYGEYAITKEKINETCTHFIHGSI